MTIFLASLLAFNCACEMASFMIIMDSFSAFPRTASSNWSFACCSERWLTRSNSLILNSLAASSSSLRLPTMLSCLLKFSRIVSISASRCSISASSFLKSSVAFTSVSCLDLNSDSFETNSTSRSFISNKCFDF